ncbi:MAG TPA: ABC transporter ATP-binding protein, partial [Candidatus Thermoplasmatota archaeon]|nr:ABC transporter ATP-binding protein [Candidatus Thermoplasmatota archaeon]
DEPTTGLDADGRARLVRVLRRPGRLVLLATHEPDLAACADRVLCIERGALVDAAPPSPTLEVAA